MAFKWFAASKLPALAELLNCGASEDVHVSIACHLLAWETMP